MGESVADVPDDAAVVFGLFREGAEDYDWGAEEMRGTFGFVQWWWFTLWRLIDAGCGRCRLVRLCLGEIRI